MVEPPARPDLILVARLLEVLAQSDRRWKRTQLQLAAGINYTQLERYLVLLQRRGLVRISETDPSVPYVELTPTGFAALGFLRKGIEEIVGSER